MERFIEARRAIEVFGRLLHHQVRKTSARTVRSAFNTRQCTNAMSSHVLGGKLLTLAGVSSTRSSSLKSGSGGGSVCLRRDRLLLQLRPLVELDESMKP